MTSGTATTEQTARIMRERLAAAGIHDGRVSVAATGGVVITVPTGARADVAALAETGRLTIYDWERSVLGPRGRTAPADPSVTGGPDAGRSAALTKTEAQSRAARRPGAQVIRAPSGWFALEGDPAITNTAYAATSPPNATPSATSERLGSHA